MLIKRLNKKEMSYNPKHKEDKDNHTKKFVEIIKPESVLDLYAGLSSFYENNFNQLN